MSRAMGSNYYAADAMQGSRMGGYPGELSTVQYAASTTISGNGMASSPGLQPVLEKIANAVLAAGN